MWQCLGQCCIYQEDAERGTVACLKNIFSVAQTGRVHLGPYGLSSGIADNLMTVKSPCFGKLVTGVVQLAKDLLICFCFVVVHHQSFFND